MTGPEDTGELIDLTRPQGRYRYEVRDRLAPAEVGDWWAIYEEAFRESNRSSPQRQTMTREEFAGAMEDPAVTKVVALDGDDIVALTIYGDVGRLGVFSWLSQEYFRDRYPGLYEAGAVQYFVATLTRPDLRSQGVMASMGQMITDDLVARWPSMVVVFDCSESNGGLPQALHALVGLTVEAADAELSPLAQLGAQEFYAFGLARRGAAATSDAPLYTAARDR